MPERDGGMPQARRSEAVRHRALCNRASLMGSGDWPAWCWRNSHPFVIDFLLRPEVLLRVCLGGLINDLLEDDKGDNVQFFRRSATSLWERSKDNMDGSDVEVATEVVNKR